MAVPQRIIDAVKKIGASEELANELIEAVRSYNDDLQKENKEKVKRVLDRAKELCVEYVENAILKNARKLKVYIESKERQLSDAAEKARRLEESEATTQLNQIASILGKNGAVNPEITRQLNAAKKTSARLEAAYASLKEENARLAKAATRANQIAESALIKAKQYKAMGTKPSTTERPPIRESRQDDRRRLIGESRTPTSRPQTSKPSIPQKPERKMDLLSSDPLVNKIARDLPE